MYNANYDNVIVIIKICRTNTFTRWILILTFLDVYSPTVIVCLVGGRTCNDMTTGWAVFGDTTKINGKTYVVERIVLSELEPTDIPDTIEIH